MMAPADKSKYKEFRLTSFAIEHATVVLVLTAIVIFLGVSPWGSPPPHKGLRSCPPWRLPCWSSCRSPRR